MNKTVRTAIDGIEAFLRTANDAYALPRDGARFCHALVLASGARRVVEIGTGYGYSTLWMAAGMAEELRGRELATSKQCGLLITIDHDAQKSEAAKAAVERAGLGSLVRFEVGHALEVLERIEGSIDFVLNDADKDHCQRYVELLAGKMRPGGVIVTDNIETHAMQLAGFLRWIRAREDFFSTPVMVGNGMEVSVKI